TPGHINLRQPRIPFTGTPASARGCQTLHAPPLHATRGTAHSPSRTGRDSRRTAAPGSVQHQLPPAAGHFGSTVETVHSRLPLAPHARRALLIFQDVHHPLLPPLLVTARDEILVYPIANDVPGTVFDVIGDHGGTRGERFPDRKTKGLHRRCGYGHLTSSDLVPDLLHATMEDDLSLLLQRAGQLFQPGKLRPATKDVQGRMGDGVYHACHRPHDMVHTLIGPQ